MLNLSTLYKGLSVIYCNVINFDWVIILNMLNQSFQDFFNKFPFPLIEVVPEKIEDSFSDFLFSVNQATLNLYAAKDLEELIRKRDFIFPEKAKNDFRHLKRAIKEGKCDIDFETVHVSCKGTLKSLQFRTVPGFDTKHNGTLLLSILDVTHYKKLINENELLARLPEINPDVVIIMKCDHSIKYVNPSGSELFNLNSDKDFHKVQQFLPNLIDKGICKHCREDILSTQEFKKNNRDYFMKVRPVSSGRECMITIADITDVKRLKKENELYSESLKSLDQAVIITDESGNIITVNRAFTELYGYSEEELKGENTRLLNPGIEAYNNLGFTNEEYNKLFDSLWKNISNPKIGKWEGTVINRTKAGKLLWVRLSISAIFSEEDEFYGYIALPIDETSSVNELNYSKIELYKTIADLSEMRDNETGNHMRRVGVFSKLLAKAYGMPEKYCDDIELFAPMHDIGKVGIADSILLAPRKLTRDEFDVMKTHTTFGYEIVKDKKDLEMAADVTLFHHERYDGKGYPNGLEGEQIPLAARIVKIVDVYDALRSKRPYKEPWSHEEAMHEINKQKGTQFDPVLVDLFLHLCKKFQKVYDDLKD